MALGLGTSAVGSPGFGQFLGQNPAALAQGIGHHPQLGSGLFAHSAVPGGILGGGSGEYHPFGSVGGTSLGPGSAGLNTGMPVFVAHQFLVKRHMTSAVLMLQSLGQV